MTDGHHTREAERYEQKQPVNTPPPWPQLSHETNSCENGLALLVLENRDQALTAKPGYCGDAPRRGGAVVISFRHGSDSLLKFLEQQPENALALES